MLLNRILLAFALLAVPSAWAATAATTLQLIWPTDTLNIDQEAAFQKTLSYLQSEEYARQVVLIQPQWKEKLADALGVNNYRNNDALAQGLPTLLQVQGDNERHVITITVTTDDADLALTLAKHCAQVAVTESRYKIAEKMDPKAAELTQQMETIEDNIQQLQTQMKLNQQRARTPANNRGGSIGAPAGMGRVVNPGANQRRTENSNYVNQLNAYRQQYNELKKELSQAVNQAWKGKPKVGLVVIDQADLEQ